MAGYGYAAKIVGERDVYQVTGDVYDVAGEDQVIEWMLKDLGEQKGEDPARCVVIEFSAIKHGA